MKRLLSILLVFVMVMSSGAFVFAEVNYTEETVPVYRDSLTSSETVVLHMFGDIPYIKIDDYYNKLIFTGAEQYPQ